MSISTRRDWTQPDYEVEINLNQIECSRILNGYERTHRFLILDMLAKAHNAMYKGEKDYGKVSHLLNDVDDTAPARMGNGCFKGPVGGKMLGFHHFTRKNYPLHWTIYNRDFAASLLVYMVEPSGIYYMNEEGDIPYDMILKFSHDHKKLHDGFWMVECLIEVFVTKFYGGGEDSAFLDVQKTLVKKFFDDKIGDDDIDQIFNDIKQAREGPDLEQKTNQFNMHSWIPHPG
jgi:hypothetical protein